MAKTRREIADEMQLKYQTDVNFREKEKERYKLYYKNHKEERRKKRKEYYYENQKKQKEYGRQHYQKNKEKQRENHKRWLVKNPNYIKEYIDKNREHIRKQWRESNKRTYERIKKYYKENKAKIRLYQNRWRRENPSSNSHYPMELQIAMNNVRKRDNNTCKWYNCGLTYKETQIHVHHIFPRSEYPELELIEQYMICYCVKHHILWHQYRGDQYAKGLSKMIKVEVINR